LASRRWRERVQRHPDWAIKRLISRELRYHAGQISLELPPALDGRRAVERVA